MPFKSKAQQKFMFSQHPEIAKKWSDMMSSKDFAHLPEKSKEKSNPPQKPQKKDSQQVPKAQQKKKSKKKDSLKKNGTSK